MQHPTNLTVEARTLSNGAVLSISLAVQPEFDSVESCFPEQEQRDTVYAMMDEHGAWGHGVVTVTATLLRGTVPTGTPLTGTDTLGSCAYAGPADFLAGGYYPQMAEAAAFEVLNELAESDTPGDGALATEIGELQWTNGPRPA